MKAAYVGILTPGSTSRMRAERLRKLTPDWTWTWIDTDPPLQNSARVWQTVAFRYQRGKAVDRINDVVMNAIQGMTLDLAWVDKAVFLRPPTVDQLRRTSTRLVHFTPDTAFHENRSRYFERTLGLFDLLVTTKSFEVDEYRERIGKDKVFLTTQGYDAEVHFQRTSDEERRREVAFVGLAEPDRERCIATLIEAGIRVRLAGRGWGSFLRRIGENRNLEFAGEDVFGSDYAELLSRAWIGLGLLSKRFPELHTTRTFEIPACGAVLATERTPETERFFTSSEALFFEDNADLAERVKSLLSEAEMSSLAAIAHAGKQRVLKDHRDYGSILGAILADARLKS